MNRIIADLETVIKPEYRGLDEQTAQMADGRKTREGAGP